MNLRRIFPLRLGITVHEDGANTRGLPSFTRMPLMPPKTRCPASCRSAATGKKSRQASRYMSMCTQPNEIYIQ